MTRNKRVNVSLSENQLALIRQLKGTMGNSDSEIVRNIVLAWFSEKGLITNSFKSNNSLNEKKLSSDDKSNDELCVISKIIDKF